MKIKIKSFNGELPEYLTLGKVYEFDKWSDDNDGGIQDDIGIGLYIFLDEDDVLKQAIELVEKCNENLIIHFIFINF